MSAILALFVCAGSVSAAQNEFRYKSWIDDRGVIYRFDNQSGEIEQLVKMPSGPPMWSLVPTAQSKPSTMTAMTALPILTVAQVAPERAQPQTMNFPNVTSNQPPHPAPPSRSSILLDAPTTMDMAYKGEPVVQKTSSRTGGGIRIFNELDVDITDDINDADRTAARSAISSYEKSLALMSTIGIGERTTGTISLANNGTKRIKALEVSIFALKAGSGKPDVLERVLFSDKAGCEKPPAPGENGYKSLAALKRIDIPTPPGALAGRPDVRITFLKFED